VAEALPRVALLTRAAQLGRVKTRLAATIGEHAALDAHEALLRGTIERLRGAAEYALALHVEGDPAALRVHGLPIEPQVQGDLGARMQAAMASMVGGGQEIHTTIAGKPAPTLERVPVGIVVGGDCPLLARAHVVSAIRSLHEGADVALVPVEDGGYVLIGMKACEPSLFTGIDWGSPRVLTQTLARAQSRRLRVALQEPLWDVDDEAGYRRWRALMRASAKSRG